MSRNGYRIMDSDMHVFEPVDMWRRYIDPRFRSRAPIGEGEQGVTLEGRDLIGAPVIVSPEVTEGRDREQARRAAIFQEQIAHEWGPKGQVLGMDREGLDAAVLFPTRALFTHAVDGMDPELAGAIGRAYDNWLHDFCRETPKRLHGAAHISPHDVELAVAETRRSVRDLGFRAIFLRSNIVNGRNWHDPYYDPLWAECQGLGIPVCFHGAANPPGIAHTAKIAEHFESLMLQHACWHPIPMMTAVMSFCAAGTLERFPRLKVAFLEGNASWVPWLLWRLDEKVEWRGYEHPIVKLRPSEYFKRQCFASTDCDEWPSRYLEDAGYIDNVVFSTDFPHSDSKYPHAVEEFLKMRLSETAKRKILWDNCARLYGMS